MNRYEFLEHAADVGMRVMGDTREAVFATAAQGLYALALVKRPEGRAEGMRFKFSGDSLAELLVQYLEELVYLLYSRHLAASRLEVRFTGELQAEACGEFAPVGADQFALEIKSPTYHQLRFEQTGTAWQAVVYLDL